MIERTDQHLHLGVIAANPCMPSDVLDFGVVL